MPDCPTCGVVIVPGMNDPMTTETARMFHDRALVAEAEVKRLREYIEAMPYASDVFQLAKEVDALREILASAGAKFHELDLPVYADLCLNSLASRRERES